MAKWIEVEATALSGAPIEQVWGVLADAKRWPEWSMMETADLEREGSPTPDGVGAIRRFTSGRYVTREEVVVFDAPTHFAYVLLSGPRLPDYRADVTLVPERASTRVTWQSRFHPPFSGTSAIARRQMRKVIQRVADDLARAAEQTA